MEILTLDEVASFLKLSRGQVYTLTRERSQRGKDPMPVARINGNLRFIKTDVEAWVKRLGGGQ